MATKAQIRTRARVRADQDNSTFPSDTQYDLLIDVAAKETWFDLIQAGWPINFATTDKTAAGTNPITLSISGTVAFIRGVFYKNGTTYTPLQRLNEGQRGNLMSATGQSAASHYAVYIDPTNGPVLELLPLPSSGTYRVLYTLEHPGFAADGTEWYGPARSDELVVLKAAAAGMRKEGNDQGAAQLDREYAVLLEKVQNMAGWFDMNNGASIRDVGPAAALGSSSRMPFDFEV
jgi:hypothetical protein